PFPCTIRFLLVSNQICRRSISFFFTAPSTASIYTLSLHDALPILGGEDPMLVVQNGFAAVHESCGLAVDTRAGSQANHRSPATGRARVPGRIGRCSTRS